MEGLINQSNKTDHHLKDFVNFSSELDTDNLPDEE